MSDIQSDGAKPYETPIAGAEQGYASILPSLGERFQANFGESSLLTQEQRVGEFGQYQGASTFQKALYAGLTTDEYGNYLGGAPEAGSVVTPTLQPSEYNEKYAPFGPDGERVPIGNEPMPEGIAKLLGKSKAQELQRNGVLDRAAQSGNPITNFGAGTAAFLADPLNLASSFVPGVGEEAITARLGGGFLARTAGRAFSGAVGGAASQAPLVAARYGLSQSEGVDYDMRRAMSDLLYAAGTNATFTAGLGALGDAYKQWRPSPGRGAPKPIEPGPVQPPPADLGPEGAGPVAPPPGPGAAPVSPDAARVLLASAEEKHAAMQTGVAQIADGRPIDISQVFGEPSDQLPPAPVEAAPTPADLRIQELESFLKEPVPKRPRDLIEFLIGQGGVQDETGELRGQDLHRPQKGRFGTLVRDKGLPLDTAREQAEQAGYLPQGSTPADLISAIGDTAGGAPRYAGPDQTALSAWQDHTTAVRHAEAELQQLRSPPLDPADLRDFAQRQQALYRQGTAPGLTQAELAKFSDEMFPKESGKEIGGEPGNVAEPAAAPAQPAENAGKEFGKQSGGGSAKLTPEDAELAQLEAAHAARTEPLSAEEQAALDRTQAGMESTAAREAAYKQAAGCIVGGAAAGATGVAAAAEV